MKEKFLLVLLLILFSLTQAQEIKKPNFAIASHPMFIENVNISSDHLVIELSIENKIAEGNFCVDKNIYIQNVLTQTKLMLLYSEDIPVCPETYFFKWVGEKLTFQLFFPKPFDEIKYMNIIEDCDEHCFSIFGLILDPEMNKLIDNSFEFFDEGNYESSKAMLMKIINEYPDYPFGYLYLNLIQVLLIQDKIEEAKEYFQQLKNSDFSDKKFILDQLKKEERLK